MAANEVAGRKVANFAACEKAGDFFLTPPTPAEGGARRLSFLCPCGCGALCGILVNDDGTQNNYAWAWDRDENAPTVTPSIAINNGHWHGYLTAGVFRPC